MKSDSPLVLPYSLVLVGHRCTGKTTFGRMAANFLGVPFVDLDDEIHERTGKTAAEWVNDDETAFRELEDRVLTDLVHGTPSIIAAGAGLRRWPIGAVILRLEREGWERDALRMRVRLRPTWDPEREISWMKETREPRFEQSHSSVFIPVGMSLSEAGMTLARHIRWLVEATGSSLLSRTWIVPWTIDEADSAAGTAQLFGLAGVEYRSDTIPGDLPSGNWMASLRTPDTHFLHHCGAATVFDVDVRFLDHVDFHGLAARRLVLSLHDEEDLERGLLRLAEAGTWLLTRWPEWQSRLEWKFAPPAPEWKILPTAMEHVRRFRAEFGALSFIIQGREYYWTRLLAPCRRNPSHYLTSGSCGRDNRPPLLDDLLPFCVGPDPTRLAGLIGDPVDKSPGPIWHRAFSVEHGDGSLGYLRIPVRSGEVHDALQALYELGLIGLSVTSPHKRTVAESPLVHSLNGQATGNTLIRQEDGWELMDTDVVGMQAALRWLLDRGIEPGPVLVVGRGGVLDAVVRGLREAGWPSPEIRSTRDAWQASGSRWRLIVNATGRKVEEWGEEPESDAVLDLQYREISSPRSDCVHESGWIFYEAQAKAQADVWAQKV